MADVSPRNKQLALSIFQASIYETTNDKQKQMVKTLDKAVTASAITVPAGTIETNISMIMPPGFTEPVSRPTVYIGGEEEGGQPFYTWNHDDNSRQYIPVNRFAGTLLELRSVVKNPDDKIKRSEKLIAEFQTSSGQRVALCCGANTYAAMGLVAGLSKLSGTDLNSEIGLSGKVGRSGKVTFVSVFANGALQRNPDAEDLLKEARNEGNVIEALKGFMNDINDRIKNGGDAEVADEDATELPF